MCRSLFKAVLVFVVAVVLAAGWRVYHDHRGRQFDPTRTAPQLARVTAAETPAALPNIVIILADDFGYGDLPGNALRLPEGSGRSLHDASGRKLPEGSGPGLLETPHLDRLAAEGVRLTNFYAAASVCTPSRVGLLTGRYPIRTLMTLPLFPTGHPAGIALNLIGRYPYGVTGILEDELLLPELLRQRGYRTALIGKWHLGDRAPHLPNDTGFEFFYGVLGSNDVSPFAVYRNRRVEIPDPADQDLLTLKYTREAVRFIEGHKGQPFFLYLAHTRVHEPLHAAREFRGKSAAGLYGDAVRELDWSVGEVLRALAELGLEQKTLVVFSSDNGPWWQGSPGGLRGRKNNLMEGGFHVPFVARWPGVLPAGRVSNEMAINFDLFPTCLKLAGVPLPNDRVIDGRDLLPVLQGKDTSLQDTFYYYFGHQLVAVRHGNWKYHRRFMSDNGEYPLFRHGPFLFDLSRDPQESYSLLESEPATAQRLAGMLDAWEAGIRANLRGWLAGR